MAEEVVAAEFTNKSRVSRSTTPAGKSVMNCQEIGIVYGSVRIARRALQVREDLPTRKEFLARSALSSKPKGDTKGDFAFNAAAIVRAGSRQRNKAAVNKNFPR